MKKEKKKSVLTRIIPYAGKRKYMLFLAMAFSALSGILLLNGRHTDSDDRHAKRLLI